MIGRRHFMIQSKRHGTTNYMLQLVTCHAETWHISACLSCDPCLCRTVINRAKINRAKINRGTWPTKHLSFLMSKPPLPEMVWHEARLSMFCLCANCILVVHAQSVCRRNHIISISFHFISWCHCPLALQWLLKWGKSSKMQWPMWTSKQLFTTSSFVLECCFSLHNTKLQTNLTFLWWCLVSQ